MRSQATAFFRHPLWIILVAMTAQVAPATATANAVFQYALPVATVKEARTAFLWIPPQATRIRGAFVTGLTLAERHMVRDSRIRKACADQGLAIVFFNTGLDSVDVPKVMNEFAKISGYGELATVPMFFAGHSAGGPQAKAAAVKHAARCFGVMQYRGGTPGGDGAFPPGIPALMMIGQFDEFGKVMRDETGRENWEGGRDGLAAFRAANDHNLGSIVVEPGGGHFGWTDRSAAYFALFLRKAAAAIGTTGAPDAKATLDPASGWLAELPSRTPGEKQPAPFRDFKGDHARAGWHFDREMVDATADYHRAGFAKKDQFIRWTDPCSVEAGARYFFNKVEWIGHGSFKVHPVYADVFPTVQKDGKGPVWPLAGKPAGRSTAPIQLRALGGPVTVAGADTLRIQFDALSPATNPGRVTFMAFSEGDARYRYVEQVGMLQRGFSGLLTGKAQVITFPEPGNLKAGAAPLELRATSDAGLRVEYYVAHGPARIENGRLTIAEIPARAIYPIAVKVVACQFGSGVEPRVTSAAPIERVLQIEKP